ncbi:hypothetical protein RHGRI_029315 [Rhododendron griersonianum]|uniref:Uncharacterized protein n=1 Tax=Rhododendron griersonianum TaxID=479676 RepID=A0AAV6IPC2_9ERIC|nr:hypothetical protein RHGRI_029315 [Rhododendron griersonianum]
MEEETATTMNNESISKSTDETNDQSSKASGRSKKVKAPKPTELHPDQRNFADLWKQVFPVGTEWEQLTKLYKYKWDFSNLENAFEEGGELYGQKVYLFGCTEPQFLFLKGEGKVICVPAMVAVVSPFPPSDKIGINSVQREVEEILPMKKMKMDWIPYIPLEDRYQA